MIHTVDHQWMLPGKISKRKPSPQGWSPIHSQKVAKTEASCLAPGSVPRPHPNLNSNRRTRRMLALQDQDGIRPGGKALRNLQE